MKGFIIDLKREFKGYSTAKLMKDMLAGLTVAAVALPLALAFGVSSGANAAAGLITAIIAGLVIGGFSGASYQISGPTGAMSAILIGLSVTYGLQGIFIASLLSGVLLLVAGICKFGRIVAFIPASVITGFTSGIAITIASGQIDNLFGVVSSGHNPIEKLASYGTLGFPISIQALCFGGLVMLLMIVYPKRLSSVFPSSLAGILVALLVNMIGNFDVAEVGEIPSTLFPEVRLSFHELSLGGLSQFLLPAISIAALGMIESLLCGASAGKMKNEKLNADRELVAQGIGNILLPFFGGVPATAAIARTSVGIKAGGQTRLVSIFHAIALLLAMFVLGPYMSRIPLSALAGVLMMTAWRMNEWKEIRFMFSRRMKSSIAQFLITMLATVIFDLTVAIVIGVLVSMILFILKNAELSIDCNIVDVNRLSDPLVHHHSDTMVMYLSGSLFFASQNQLLHKVEEISSKVAAIVISMRGISSVDDAGIQELQEVYTFCKERRIRIIFCGIQKNVWELMYRHEFFDFVGGENITWDAIAAIKVIDAQYQ